MLHRRKFFSILILFSIFYSQSTEAFSLLEFFRSCVRYLYSIRLFQRKEVIKTRIALPIIQNLLKASAEEKIKLLKDESQETLRIIFEDPRDGELTSDEYQKYCTTLATLYQSQIFFNLKEYADVINQFLQHQHQALKSGTWLQGNGLENIKNHTLANLHVVTNIEMEGHAHNSQGPSFYITKLLFDSDESVYLLSDLHGGVDLPLDLLKTLIQEKKFDLTTGILAPGINIVFKGDLVDKGPNGVGCTAIAFALKLLNPNQVFLTRGCHENPSANGPHENIKTVPIWLNLLQDNNKKPKPNWLNFFPEICLKYYQNPKSFKERFLQFIYPKNYLLEQLRKSYNYMPVMAFTLFKNHASPQSAQGFLAVHGGIDPTYDGRILSCTDDKRIVFDAYPTDCKIHANNTEALVCLQKAIVDTVIQAWKKDPRKNNPIEGKILTKKDVLSYINALPQKRATDKQGRPVTKHWIDIIYYDTCNKFSAYFQSHVHSAFDVGAMWHWQCLSEDDLLRIDPKKGGGFDCNISKAFAKAILRDWNAINEEVKIRGVSRGHQQTCSFHYNIIPDLMDSIDLGKGYNDVWKPDTVNIVGSKIKIRNRKFRTNGYYTIGASNGSIYGVSQIQMYDENTFNTKLKEIEEEQAKKGNPLVTRNPYQGPTYNPIVWIKLSNEDQLTIYQTIVQHPMIVPTYLRKRSKQIDK
jgi:hypothetical protein